MTGMKTLVLAFLLSTASVHVCHAQVSFPPTEPAAERERMKADRAAAAEERKNSSLARPWDKDADGKRPWQQVAPPATIK
jgi:hypothetical protein